MEDMSAELYPQEDLVVQPKIEDYDDTNCLLEQPRASQPPPANLEDSVNREALAPAAGFPAEGQSPKQPSPEEGSSPALPVASPTEPAQRQPARKRKRPSSQGPDAEEKRRLNRERNRQAASRCRQNKKVQNRRTTELQIHLQAQNSILKEELGKEQAIKDSLLCALEAHTNCGDPNVIAYLAHFQRQAQASREQNALFEAAASPASAQPAAVCASTSIFDPPTPISPRSAAYVAMQQQVFAAARIANPPLDEGRFNPQPAAMAMNLGAAAFSSMPAQSATDEQLLAAQASATQGPAAARHDSLQSSLSSAPSSYTTPNLGRGNSVARRSSSVATSLQDSPFIFDDWMPDDKQAADAANDTNDFMSDPFGTVLPFGISAGLF